MDIEISSLKAVSADRDIPFEELISIVEQAILMAYLKHTEQLDNRGATDSTARVEVDRKTGHARILVPEVDDDGVVLGEVEDAPEDFGRIAAFAAKQVIVQRLRDIGDDKVLGEFKTKEGEIVAGVKPGRSSAGQLTIADLTGVGFQDTAIASKAIGLVIG